jgi:hypothetical protein
LFYFQIVVANNNIYYLKPWNSLKGIESSDYLEVTSNGLKDVIYNGVPDWLYEGKLFIVSDVIYSRVSDWFMGVNFV